MKRILAISIMMWLCCNGCSQNRTNLTDQEKKWNPYKERQLLIFGLVDGLTDTIKISSASDKIFPDGIGSLQNERLRVTALHKLPESNKSTELVFLWIYAKSYKYPSGIDFEFFFNGDTFWGRGYAFDELEKYKEISVQTRYGKFDDVLRIEDNSNRPVDESNITTIYWSKSVGYVKYERKDGVSCELIKIIDP